MEEATYSHISQKLDQLPVDTQQKVALFIDLGFLPDDQQEGYLEYLVIALKSEKHKAYGQNVYFVLRGGNAALREQALNNISNQGLFILESEIPEDAQRVQLFTGKNGLSFKFIRNVLTQKLTAGDVPTFRSEIKFAIFTGRLNLDNISDAYLTAWEALSQQKLTREIARGIIEGTIALLEARRYALRPLTRVNVNLAVQAFKNMARMISKSV